MNRLIRNTIRLLSPAISPKLLRVSSRGYADGFSYLLPDSPPDDASNNYMLRLPKQGELIDFQKVDPHQSFRAVLKTLFELEGCYEELTALDEAEICKLSFDDLYKQVDAKLAELNYAYSMFEMMSVFDPQRFTLRKGGNTALIKAYNDVRSSAFKSRTIFKAMINLDRQSDRLTNEQKQIVRKYLTEGKLNGLHLESDLAVDQINKIITKFKQDFISNINTHSQEFVHFVINADYVKTVPHYLRSILAGGSKVKLTLHPPIYQHFMANCNDQYERYQFWFAYNNRASMNNCSRQKSNNIVVDEIVDYHRKLANRLGFVNYIEYALQTRSLDSIMMIKEFIDKLFEQSREAYNQDLGTVLKFAASFPDYKSKNLNIWDLPFFSTQFKNQQLSAVTKDLNHYFPVEQVIEGVFKFLVTNFNIKIERIQSKTLKESALGDELNYYRMYYNDQFVGNFFVNLYCKTKTPHIRNIADRCDQLGLTPIAGIFLNYDKPLEEQHLTMSFAEVISVFKSFGFVLDHLLPKNAYAEISGQNSINKDFKELTSNLMTLFAFHDYNVIKECSKNVFTGEPLPERMHKQLVEGHLRLKSLTLTEELYRTALDFALYSQDQSPIDIQRAIYNKFMSPFDFGNENNHLCSDVLMICGRDVGGYYSSLFSQVLAADLFMSTRRSHDDHSAPMKSSLDLLSGYVNNFLLNENGANNLEPFRKIQGRDFSIRPYLLLNQLDHQQIAEKPSRVS